MGFVAGPVYDGAHIVNGVLVKITSVLSTPHAHSLLSTVWLLVRWEVLSRLPLRLAGAGHILFPADSEHTRFDKSLGQPRFAMIISFCNPRLLV